MSEYETLGAEIARRVMEKLTPEPVPLTELQKIAADLAAIVPLGAMATDAQKCSQASAREKLIRRRLEIQGYVDRQLGGAELLKKFGAS